mmetsp:Transcript_145074/g.361872  ORF Transcript_145074/g.361872 Transcript_145074/m.361872 type:complete len:227 (-) Transcript_145074:325-1005(-)
MAALMPRLLARQLSALAPWHLPALGLSLPVLWLWEGQPWVEPSTVPWESRALSPAQQQLYGCSKHNPLPQKPSWAPLPWLQLRAGPPSLDPLSPWKMLRFLEHLSGERRPLVRSLVQWHQHHVRFGGVQRCSLMLDLSGRTSPRACSLVLHTQLWQKTLAYRKADGFRRPLPLALPPTQMQPYLLELSGQRRQAARTGPPRAMTPKCVGHSRKPHIPHQGKQAPQL